MTYYIMYKMVKYGTYKGVCVCAKNKLEAYRKAIYEMIPAIEGNEPYAAWVESVTYSNGNYKSFNTFEGKPY